MRWISKKSLPVQDNASLFLAWMSALMVFIATLFLVGALCLNNMISSWQCAISGSLTIQIPTYTLSGENRQEAAEQDIEKITDILKQTAGVDKVTLLNPEQMRALMEPWLGVSEDIDSLPLPKLLDIQLNPAVPFDFDMLKTQIQKQAPETSVDSHRLWLAHLVQTAKSIQNMIVFILVLLVLTTSFTVVYTTTSGLALQAAVIKLLHMMGARDMVIATQYASSHFIRAFLGGLSGFVLALPIIWITSTLFNPVQDPFVDTAALSLPQIYCVLSLPLWASVFAFVTAFLTVLKTLRRVL